MPGNNTIRFLAILSTAMYATVKAGGPVHAQRIMLRPSLSEDVAFVSRLLKSEFIYGPGGLEKNLDETIERLHKANVISIEEDVATNEEGEEEVRQWIALSAEERRIGRETFGRSAHSELRSIQYTDKISLSYVVKISTGRDLLILEVLRAVFISRFSLTTRSYSFLMWPFIETYWLAAVSLFSIIPDIPPPADGQSPILEWVDERVFMNRAQFFGKTLYYEGTHCCLYVVVKFRKI